MMNHGNVFGFLGFKNVGSSVTFWMKGPYFDSSDDDDDDDDDLVDRYGCEFFFCSSL